MADGTNSNEIDSGTDDDLETRIINSGKNTFFSKSSPSYRNFQQLSMLFLFSLPLHFLSLFLLASFPPLTSGVISDKAKNEYLTLKLINTVFLLIISVT